MTTASSQILKKILREAFPGRAASVYVKRVDEDNFEIGFSMKDDTVVTVEKMMIMPGDTVSIPLGDEITITIKVD